eukprot:554978-Amphidinium_carterae.1
MYGAEVNGLSQALLRKLRSAGRAALGKGARKRRSAKVELTLAGRAAKRLRIRKLWLMSRWSALGT